MRWASREALACATTARWRLTPTWTTWMNKGIALGALNRHVMSHCIVTGPLYRNKSAPEAGMVSQGNGAGECSSLLEKRSHTLRRRSALGLTEARQAVASCQVAVGKNRACPGEIANARKARTSVKLASARGS